MLTPLLEPGWPLNKGGRSLCYLLFHPKNTRCHRNRTLKFGPQCSPIQILGIYPLSNERLGAKKGRKRRRRKRGPHEGGGVRWTRGSIEQGRGRFSIYPQLPLIQGPPKNCFRLITTHYTQTTNYITTLHSDYKLWSMTRERRGVEQDMRVIFPKMYFLYRSSPGIFFIQINK